MSLIPVVLSTLTSWIGRMLGRFFNLNFSLDGIALDEQELVDQLQYGRD
ncbi:MAG: hypothetical protein GY906_36060 [bacterium]|nr:hypothetical protein [bacterium]